MASHGGGFRTYRKGTVLPCAAAVLLDDRDENEGKGDQSRQVEERLLLVGNLSQSERDARQGVDGKRQCEQQEEGVTRFSPKAKKE